MNTNRIRPIDDVKVDIYFNGEKIDGYQGSGYHTVEEAVTAAYESSDRTRLGDEDYVYRVTNLTTGSTARYRFNAGENLKILPEEK